MHIGHLGIAIIKILLLTYLLVDVAALIIVRRRRMRAARDEFMHRDLRKLQARYTRSGQPGNEAPIDGATPQTSVWTGRTAMTTRESPTTDQTQPT